MLLGEQPLVPAEPRQVGWALHTDGDPEAQREKGPVAYGRCCFPGPFLSCVEGALSHFLR